MEIVHSIADFIQYRRLAVTQLIRLPQGNDFIQQLLTQLFAFPEGQGRVIQTHHIIGDTLMNIKDRPPHGFRRVSRHDQLQRQAVHDLMNILV
ncbi:hypothetical protein D3C73_718260 [compost metagenome]